jgi:hypothetical protein
MSAAWSDSAFALAAVLVAWSLGCACACACAVDLLGGSLGGCACL